MIHAENQQIPAALARPNSSPSSSMILDENRVAAKWSKYLVCLLETVVAAAAPTVHTCKISRSKKQKLETSFNEKIVPDSD